MARKSVFSAIVSHSSGTGSSAKTTVEKSTTAISAIAFFMPDILADLDPIPLASAKDRHGHGHGKGDRKGDEGSPYVRACGKRTPDER